MSTHANIYLPYGDFVIYKHHDGYPSAILPPLVRCIAESSIFIRKRDDDPKSIMYHSTQAELVDEMGYFVSRIITQFAVLDYRRRTSTGIQFEDRDISGIVSPTKVCRGGGMYATYTYRITKIGEIDVFMSNDKRPRFTVPYKADLNGPLDQLMLACEEEADGD